MSLIEKKYPKVTVYVLALALVCSFKLVLAADSYQFKLMGNLIRTSTFINGNGLIYSRSILSPDGSHLLNVSLKVGDKGVESKQYFAVFTVWNISQSAMTQVSTIEKLLEDPYNQFQLMGARFSANNEIIVFSQHAPHDNFFWEFETSDKTEVACPSFMGSTITAVSETGKYFAVTTDDDYQVVCETYSRVKKGYFDLFFYGRKPFENQQVADLKKLGNDVKAIGFVGDKLLITYPENEIGASSKRQFKEFTFKYPQAELVAIEDADKAITPKVIKESRSDAYVDLFSREAPPVEAIRTDLFGDKSYLINDYVFENFGCQTVESSRYYKNVGQDRKIRSIKGGFAKMSVDGNTLLSCDDERLYVYRRQL